jgi:Calcineurin-like phosphoesterase.
LNQDGGEDADEMGILGIEVSNFVILDAPHETPSATVNMPEEQINWLRRDLSLNEDRKILVFYHEPLSEWGRSSSEVLDLLREYDVDGLFCGHTHHDVLTNLGGIPEQQTGAVCGNWWSNKETPYGSPGGYRIIVVTEGGISTSYRGVAS